MRWQKTPQRRSTPLFLAGYVSFHNFVDIVLTLWPYQGSWGGAGAKKAPPKPHLIKKVAGVDPTSRADYKKAHVIISEKRDKKAAKYLVKDLPYPYTSRAQFERSMEVPVGTEWNTRLGFQRATLPKVVTKVRAICAALGSNMRLTCHCNRWDSSSRRSKSNIRELQLRCYIYLLRAIYHNFPCGGHIYHPHYHLHCLHSLQDHPIGNSSIPTDLCEIPDTNEQGSVLSLTQI